MNLDHHQGGWVIFASFILAILLMLIPLPLWAGFWRPDWVAMVLIYWCMALPQRVGVFSGWLVGLVLDVLLGSLLGQHALVLALVAYLSGKVHRRLRVYPLRQQVFVVFSLVAMVHVFNAWMRHLQGYPTASQLEFLYPAMTSFFLWPWVFISLRMLRRGLHVR